MRVGTAWRFKTAMRIGEAGENVVGIGRAQRFVRSPAAGGITLRDEKIETGFLRRADVFRRRA